MASDTDILTEIKDKLVSLERNANTAKESKDSGSLWGWVVALIVGAAVSIGAALLIWKLNKKNEELAKLRTQVEQDEIKADQLQHELSIAGPQGKIYKLAAEAAETLTRIVTNTIKLDQETTRYAEAMLRVEAARDWDQLDARNSNSR